MRTSSHVAPFCACRRRVLRGFRRSGVFPGIAGGIALRTRGPPWANRETVCRPLRHSPEGQATATNRTASTCDSPPVSNRADRLGGSPTHRVPGCNVRSPSARWSLKGILTLGDRRGGRLLRGVAPAVSPPACARRAWGLLSPGGRRIGIVAAGVVHLWRRPAVD